MPLTGFLDGFNEQRLTEQRLQDEAQMNQLRAVEVGMGLQKMQRQAVVESTLSRVFAGGAATAPGQDPETALASKMEQAAPLIMAVDPQIGLHLATGASEIRTRKALAKQREIAGQEKAAEQQGGILASADSQNNYPLAMQQYKAAGGQVPAWYTGDWEADKPRVQQLVKSTMSAKDQAMVSRKDLEAGIKIDAEQRKVDALAAKVTKDAADAKRAQEEHDRKVVADDKRAAATQQRIKAKSVANLDDTIAAKNELRNRPEAERFDDTQLGLLAARAATSAKSRLVMEDADEGDYISLVNEELDKLLDPKKGTVDLGEKSKWFDPFGLTGRKATIRSPRAAAAPPAGNFPKPSPEALAYLKAHPETATKFKEVYGYAP